MLMNYIIKCNCLLTLSDSCDLKYVAEYSKSSQKERTLMEKSADTRNYIPRPNMCIPVTTLD